MILNRSARILGVKLERERRRGDLHAGARHAPHRQPAPAPACATSPRWRATGASPRRSPRRRSTRLGVDAAGLDAMDRKILLAILDKFGGGPVGVETIAASVGEQRDTIEDVYEPFLLQEGFLQRTPRGRVATHRAYIYFNRKAPTSAQGTLW